MDFRNRRKSSFSSPERRFSRICNEPDGISTSPYAIQAPTSHALDPIHSTVTPKARGAWLPVTSKHCSAVSLRLTNSGGGGLIRATISARCLNGSWPPLESKMFPKTCSPSKVSQIRRGVSSSSRNSTQEGLCSPGIRGYKCRRVPPLHLEYHLWRPVNVRLEKRAGLLGFADSRFPEVTQDWGGPWPLLVIDLRNRRLL